MGAHTACESLLSQVKKCYFTLALRMHGHVHLVPTEQFMGTVP